MPSKVTESNEKNNYALVPLFKKDLSVYFDVNTGYTSVNNEIKEYIKLFVNEEATQSNADVTLCVGKKCNNFNSLNQYTLKDFRKKQKFGNQSSKLTYQCSTIGSKPYNAIIGGFHNLADNKKYIMAYGTDIDGDIAALKKLISQSDIFLRETIVDEERLDIIDD